jgi:hypothetical protein
LPGDRRTVIQSTRKCTFLWRNSPSFTADCAVPCSLVRRLPEDNPAKAESAVRSSLPAGIAVRREKPSDPAQYDTHGVAADGRSTPPTGSASRSFETLLRVAGAVAAPPATVIALAYYFAVKRQQTLALHFGIDTSVLGFSTQDYLLRGGDALFLVLLFASLLGLAGILAHTALTRRADGDRLRRASIWLRAVGAALLATGLVAVFEPLPLSPHFLFRSLSFGAGIVLLAYGTYLAGRSNAGSLFGGDSGAQPDMLLVTSIVLVAVVAFLSIFWATKDLAQALGRGQARQLENAISAQPGAIVYSERRLYIAAPGVTETALPAGGYRFRYTGLRLLVRSGGKYFLIPDQWSRATGVVVVLADDANSRVDFTRGRR